MSATGRGLSGAMILALSYAPVEWGRNAAIRAGGLVVREFVGGTCKLHTEATEEQRALAGCTRVCGGWSVQTELGLHFVERVDLVWVFLVIANSLLDEGVKFFESVRAFWVREVVLERGQDGGAEPLVVVLGALADSRRLCAGCDRLGGSEFMLFGAPERRDVPLLFELVLDEGVEEFVVEGLVPRLAGEFLSEVRAALTHDRLEADHGGALGGHHHVLGGGREPDDVRPVVGEHRLVPRDTQLKLRVVESYPHHYVYHPLTVVGTGDGREELVERLDCHDFTLSRKRADQPCSALCLSTLCKTKGAARGFPRAAPSSLKLSLCA